MLARIFLTKNYNYGKLSRFFSTEINTCKFLLLPNVVEIMLDSINFVSRIFSTKVCFSGQGGGGEKFVSNKGVITTLGGVYLWNNKPLYCRHL